MLHASVLLAQDQAPATQMAVTPVSPMQFNYATPDLLFQRQTISNAFDLELKVKQEPIFVMAQTNFSSSLAENAFNNLLLLRMRLTNSNNVSVPAAEVKLSATPSLLLSQPGSVGGVKQLRYSYDVALDPITDFIPEGNYVFSIIFTMTLQ